MKRSTVIILFLLGLLVLAIALWPSDGDGKSNGSGNQDPGYAEEPEQVKKTPEQIEVEECEYEPSTVYVHKNTSLQEAVYVYNTNIQNVEEKKNIGGTKLIAEMSADVDGMHTSRNPNSDCKINIYPMNVLKIHLEQNTTKNVFYKIKKTDISMISSKVSIQQSKNTGGTEWESLLELVDEFLQALLSGCKMEVNLIFINNTSKPVSCEIPQGQLLETEAEDAQNLVVYETINFNVQPRQQVEITAPVYCAAHRRGSPVDSKVRFTPYVLNAPSSVYKSQQDVWDYIESPARNRIVFYCWRKGDLTRSGELSKTGHAFVYIPGVGYQGFGTEGVKKHFGIYEKGALFNHSALVRYATDSCICYITDMQLEKAKAKYYEWYNNTPHYTASRYDCTTFALDIADAAEIYYGWRIQVQTPGFFMDQLKKYNQPKR